MLGAGRKRRDTAGSLRDKVAASPYRRCDAGPGTEEIAQRTR